METQLSAGRLEKCVCSVDCRLLRGEVCNMKAPNHRSCVSWLLLASYAVMLGVGGVGLLVSVNNFWEEEPLPPTPPPVPDNTTATTTGGLDYYRHSLRFRNDKAYQEYVYASHDFARATSDARLYIVLPCSACVVVAAMVLVGGLWSQHFFSSTFGLYNSLGLWILTLSWTIVYQIEISWNRHMNLDVSCWVLVFHIVLLLLLFAQILLCGWELRQQKAGWPTINCRNLFTLEAVLLIARMTLTGCTFVSLNYSVISIGYIQDHLSGYYWEDPSTRWPLVFSIVCFSAVCYSAVATVETILSMLLGKLQIQMTSVTALVSTLCCGTIVVLTSPAVMKAINPSVIVYLETTCFAIGLSVVTSLHVVACLAFPAALRSPSDSINRLSNLLVSSMSPHGNGIVKELLRDPTPQQEKGMKYMIFNQISAMYSIFSITIAVAAWSSPWYRSWGVVMVLIANSATLVRTLPAFVLEFVFNETEDKSLHQKLMVMSLECISLLVGATAVCALCYHGMEIFAGAINLLFFLFQISICVQLLKEKFTATQSEKEEFSAEIEKVCIKGNNDEQSLNDPSA